jgi:hypothetical protein
MHIKKLIAAAFFILVVQMSFAAFSFTGITDENSKDGKYSLKNLSNYSHKAFSISQIKTNLQYKGFVTTNSLNSTQGYLQFDKGNTSYVLPYKYKVKATKFKTPSADNR